MSDLNSSLPVRTQSPGDVVAILADATIPSQQLAIDASGKITAKINDGAGNSVSSQSNGSQTALDVGVNVLGVQIDPRDIRALTSSDVVTSAQGAAALIGSAWPVKLTDGTNTASLTGSGEVKADITQPLPAGTNLIGKATLSQGGNDANVTASNALKVDGSAVTQPVSGTVTANQGGAPWSQNITQLSGATPSATNALPAQIATAGAFISNMNPLPVIVSPVGSGTPKNYYTDSSAIAIGASATQSTTAAGSTGFYMQQVQYTASGKCKAVVQVETAVASGIFTVIAAGFNSTAHPNGILTFPPTLIATGVRVQVVMTNTDLGATDLYSTVSGYQI